ncbi:MAG: GTPase Era [Anaerolineae bacterium]|nr:GTPase Era [Anaerolineae bacterium]MDK1082348.1 GTPase Era [Anaerolineae bacterium]MDK1119278.1 GTPase Era [Anaerolineae bacterium]
MNLEPHMDFRAGYVAVIGRPNVGKSTLINTLLGQKIAAVTPKAQTTRRRQLGILTTDNSQIVFVDTPGIHNPRHKLGKFLNQEAEAAIPGVDVVLFLVDVSVAPKDEDKWIATRLSRLARRTPLVLAPNKIDLVPAQNQTANLEAYQALVPNEAQMIPISATSGQGLESLLAALMNLVPLRKPDYEPDQITDMFERDIAMELIREACLLNLRDEVPHGVAVRIDEFTERGQQGAYIAATIFIERESQKGIVIGRGGEMLKQIGTAARREIEEMSGRKVFLELRVKLLKDWRKNEKSMLRFGYRIKKKRKK